MKQKRRSKGKRIRPNFFVFCEGETEGAYIKYLRSCYRLPIEVVIKITGTGISEQFIDNYKECRPTDPKDKTFLIYDYDVPEIVDKLKKINKIDVIFSNPCFELWYLLHCQNQTAELTTTACHSKLTNHIRDYKKGTLCDKLKTKLANNKNDAISRAMSLRSPDNPFTDVYRFIKELDSL
jgi:hypothetical protein